MAHAFLDVSDARVVLFDLSWGKPIDFIGYKGGKDGYGDVISCMLKINRITVFEARKLTFTTLAYLHARDVLFLQQLYQVNKNFKSCQQD